MQNREFVPKLMTLSTALESMRASGTEITRESLLEEINKTVSNDAEKAIWESTINGLGDDSFAVITEDKTIGAMTDLREGTKGIDMAATETINVASIISSVEAFNAFKESNPVVARFIPFEPGEREASAFNDLVNNIETATQEQVAAGAMPETAPEEERKRSNGFMDMLSGMGPIGAIIGAIISFFTQMFGGGSEQQETTTTVTPPAGQRNPNDPENQPETQPEQEVQQEVQQEQGPTLLDQGLDYLSSFFAPKEETPAPGTETNTGSELDAFEEPSGNTPDETETAPQQSDNPLETVINTADTVIDLLNPLSYLSPSEGTPTTEQETSEEPTLPTTVTNPGSGVEAEEAASGDLSTPQTGQNSDPTVQEERAP